ncbi:MAG: DUF2079 domain-containing protein [Archangiaceae bacterium]|nr:DUF2079 domain-containing protein [Archangiaceae bacterium]
MRRKLGVALFALAALSTLVFLSAALTGGWALGPLSLLTGRPVRFPLLIAFAGWFVLPPADREALGRWCAARERAVLLGGLGAFALWGLLFRVTRWLALDTGAYDLSLFESTLLNTLDGQFMHAWGLGRSLFSEHFEPIVLAVLPFYALVHHPMVLLLAQWVGVTAALLPLYFVALRLGLGRRLAVLACAAYVFNAIVVQSNRFDFHPELFGPVAVFWALHASVTRRWASLYAALAFAFTLKEEMALVMACFALLVLRGEGRRWPHALAVAALSVAWGAVTFLWVMPHFHPVHAGFHPLASRWAQFGTTYPEIAVGLLTHPGYLLGVIFSEPTLKVFASLGFVPLLDPLSVAAALPPLLAHLTADYGYAAKLGAYYGLLGTTLLFAGLLFALRTVRARFGAHAAFAAGALAIGVTPNWPVLDRVSGADLAAARFIGTIPEADVVCAQSPIAPHRRPTARLLMVPQCEGAQWILMGNRHDPWPIDEAEHAQRVAALRADPLWKVVFEEGDYVFLQRVP